VAKFQSGAPQAPRTRKNTAMTIPGRFRQMIGHIDADNAVSLGLHAQFGFARVGLLPGVAYRYGRRADSVMVQRSLGPGSTVAPLSRR
jgi:L-amino acid N-acyltransferase YncA